MEKRFTFFLADDDYVVDQEKVSELDDSDDQSVSPSDRVLEEIRSKKVRRGQFGIGIIFWIITLISLVCAAPNLIGCDVTYYWIGIALLAWMFTPGLIYVSYWAGNAYGFNSAFHLVICLLTITTIPSVLFFFLGAEFLYATVLWIPQIPVLIWLHFLFRKGKSKSKQTTVFRQF